MNESAQRIAFLAVFTALGTLLLLLSGVLPAGRLALLALASFPVCMALMRYGPGWAAGVCAVTAALGFLLFPGAAVVGYAAFFGWYPIAKSLCERFKSRYAGRALKLAVYTLAAVLYWFFARALIDGTALPWFVLYLVGAVVFFVFDWAYSLIIRLYIEKIARFLK